MRVPISLRGKMLAFTFGVVAVLGGLSVAVIHHFVAEHAKGEVVADLAKTMSVFEKFMRERGLWLRSQGLVVAEDPRFTATLDIRGAEIESQARTVLREARRFQGIIGSDHFIATNREGRVLARIDVVTAAGGSLKDAPSVRQALRGESSPGTWTHDGVEYQVASVPVREATQLVATLTLGTTGTTAEPDLLDAAIASAMLPDVRKALASGQLAAATSVARQLQADLEVDLVALTDATGAGRGLVLRLAGRGPAEPDSRLRVALEGREFVGLRAEGEGIAQMVIVPVWARGEVIGALATSFDVDDRLARDLRDMMRSEISFAVGGRVVASTWPEPVRRQIEGQLATTPAVMREGARPFEMSLGKETYVSLLGRLEAAEGSTQVVYVVQRSLDEATRFLATLERMLLMIGGAVLLAAGLLSFAGVTRIVKPVRALVEGTRRVAAGDLTRPIPVTSNDEIGELSQSFNEMAWAVATSRDALGESEHRYRDLFDHAQDVVYTTDPKMNLTSMNEAGLKLLGYQAEELVGRSFYELFAPEDAARLKIQDVRLPAGAARPAIEAVVRRKDGTEATLEIASRWITEGGRPVGVHGIGRDITERRERELATHQFRERVHQAEKLRALGEMAVGVAHNFNNALMGVVGYAQLMESRARTAEEYKRYARMMVESAEQCGAIVRRIQTFGRPIDVTQREPVDLLKVVRDTVDLTQPKWKAAPEREGRTVRVKLELVPLPLIESTGAAWEEIISNLIFNAVDAMPKGGTITIATRQEGSECVLEVRDTGIGMDKDTQRRIFEPFFTTKGPELGSGLGLSTVWGLVHAQGGQIDVASAPGEGTSFTVRMLPAAVPAVSREEPVSTTVGPSLRILVIDDEPTVRDVLPEMLVNHEVVTAPSGAEGLERFGESAFDVVISDWSMAGISGLEVAAEIKRQRAGTIVILMTGWEVGGAAAAYNSGVDLFLQKPISLAELDRVLGEAFQLREQRSEGQHAG